MNARDLIEGEAELDDEENDESFDEETGEVKQRSNGLNGHLDDSSEEEEDDEDEEAARAVRQESYHFGGSVPGLIPYPPRTDSRRLHSRRG